jgi:hypothetical protein
LRNEHGHDLIADTLEKNHVHENRIKLILQPLDGILGIKRETDVEGLSAVSY